MRLYVAYVAKYPDQAPTYKLIPNENVDADDLEELQPIVEEKVSASSCTYVMMC